MTTSTDNAALNDLLAKVDALKTERNRVLKRLEEAERAVLDERFKDWPKYEVGDIVIIPRKLFGKIREWPAQIADVRLNYSSGYYPETARPEIAGKFFEHQSISYRVFLKQADGTFGGSSDTVRHDHVIRKEES